MSPFDYVKAIQATKQNLMADPQGEKEYVSFIVNKALSSDLDTIMDANEMNRRHHLDKKMQFGYLVHHVRARKRPFHPWLKHTVNADVAAIKVLWECSTPKALEILRVLTPEQMEGVRKITDLGGKSKKPK